MLTVVVDLERVLAHGLVGLRKGGAQARKQQRKEGFHDGKTDSKGVTGLAANDSECEVTNEWKQAAMPYGRTRKSRERGLRTYMKASSTSAT